MKNKIIDLINNFILKRQGIFTENFTIFISNAGKTGNVLEFKLDKFLEDHLFEMI